MEPIVNCFSLGSEAHGYAVQFLRVHCLSMAIAWVTSFALPNALRAAGDARYVMYVAATSMWVVRVSLAYILVFPLGVGPLGVWLAMGADFLCRGTFYALRWKSGKWQSKRVIG
jgi:Na+-driven multidrug efflux pump